MMTRDECLQAEIEAKVAPIGELSAPGKMAASWKMVEDGGTFQTWQWVGTVTISSSYSVTFRLAVAVA